ncbi:hypothetical protein Tco_1012067 [Tanacetum coccineum]
MAAQGIVHVLTLAIEDEVWKLGTIFKDINVACDVITFGDPYYDKRKVFNIFIESANNKGNMCGHCKSLAHAAKGYYIRCGIYEQKTDLIVYVTLAAKGYYGVKDFAAHRDFKNEDLPTMSYLGYQTSGNEQRKLAYL